MTSKSFNIPRHWWGKIIGGVIGWLAAGWLAVLTAGYQRLARRSGPLTATERRV